MNWDILPATEGESLSLKGFLYQTKDGRWILSAEPNLKSCCIGAQNKKETQVFLLDDFSSYSTNIPLEVSGIFHCIEEERYSLSATHVVQHTHFPVWTLAFILVSITLIVGIKLKRLLLP